MRTALPLLGYLLAEKKDSKTIGRECLLHSENDSSSSSADDFSISSRNHSTCDVEAETDHRNVITSNANNFKANLSRKISLEENKPNIKTENNYFHFAPKQGADLKESCQFGSSLLSDENVTGLHQTTNNKFDKQRPSSDILPFAYKSIVRNLYDFQSNRMENDMLEVSEENEKKRSSFVEYFLVENRLKLNRKSLSQHDDNMQMNATGADVVDSKSIDQQGINNDLRTQLYNLVAAGMNDIEGVTVIFEAPNHVANFEKPIESSRLKEISFEEPNHHSAVILKENELGSIKKTDINENNPQVATVQELQKQKNRNFKAIYMMGSNPRKSKTGRSKAKAKKLQEQKQQQQPEDENISEALEKDYVLVKCGSKVRRRKLMPDVPRDECCIIL